MRLVERRQRPVLRLQPLAVPLGPRLLRAGEAAAVPQQEFGQPMARAQEIRADVFATAQEIARRFFLLGRDVDRRQRAGAIEDGELARIAPIGLDPIAGPPRNQRRRDDVTGNAVCGQRALQLKPTRARLRSSTGPGRGAAARRTAESSGLSDVSGCSAGVRWPGSNTAATVVAAC